jgi:hypothetical protein
MDLFYSLLSECFVQVLDFVSMKHVLEHQLLSVMSFRRLLGEEGLPYDP